MTNRFLEGNGSGYIEAGLPNITGNITTPQVTAATGAFASSATGNYWNVTTAGGNKDISFDASWSNSIYGNSTTVQPATCKCHFVIKY